MAIRQHSRLTSLVRFFLEPKNAAHRRYEALRAFFVDGLRSVDVAQRFGYTPGSVRGLCHNFRKKPRLDFFEPKPRVRSGMGKMAAAKEKVIQLRKQNLSVYDISRALDGTKAPLTPAAISLILRDEGFAKLPRRRDEDRMMRVHPTTAAVADVRELNLSPRTIHTKYGGLFLFLPDLVAVGLDDLAEELDLPGSSMIPAGHAMRSLLALKLVGSARKRQVMNEVLDEGLALFPGLNAIPKRSFLTVYSTRVEPSVCRKVMAKWFDRMVGLGLEAGGSFDLDFHTIPFHGQDALVEKHYVSKRSRKQKGLLAFVAQDSEGRLFCYGNGALRSDERNDEILRFVRYWKQRTGKYPAELVFDSQLTTYENLNQLNRMKIAFITLRRRSADMLDEVRRRNPAAWRRIELENVTRIYRTPKIIDSKIEVKGYTGSMRQLIVDDLGHEEPTFLITNQMRRSPSQLVGRYARRMIIENTISDGIDFFHMDALSSWIPMRVDVDLKLTLMASSLYRMLATKIGNGYKTARSRTLFDRFVDSSATIRITQEEVIVKFQKRANNPLLRAAGFEDTDVPVPWFGNKRLRLQLG